MEVSERKNSRIIDGTALCFSLALLAASAAGAVYTGTGNTLFADFLRILTSPGPLITDYFGVGSLPAAFLNAGLCGLAMWAFMVLLPGPSHVNTFAGFFLVIAHAFYGLNFLNMWPCFLAPFLYIRIRRLDYNQNLHICMFCTCFSPFVSELLFRYDQGSAWVPGTASLTGTGIALTMIFILVLAFVAPAILPGTRAWHKGYNLYNGGLAFGMLGFFLFNLLYRTVGVSAPAVVSFDNPVYEQFGRSYRAFGYVFFLSLFALCAGAGFLLNGRSFRGLSRLFTDTGYESNFAAKYGMPLCLINVGIYGALFLVYVSLVERFTPGAGFTGPTFGVIFAALTFTAMGQHPRNVWPIYGGYLLLFLLANAYNALVGGDASWTLSTQAYINSVAFATGLCPLVGRYGVVSGIIAGMLCASLAPATSALHGGLMLYNGGFTAGITTLILLPILEHYLPHPRASMNQHMDLRDMMVFDESVKRAPREKQD
ncbi:MAG: DUF1576 domain-containing protein [Oscillospiraceae bacterium]|nr:DUF1576 domain-containing protein [Oscillospiraceae bacterium]